MPEMTLTQILSSYSCFTITDRNRLICSLTHHEIPLPSNVNLDSPLNAESPVMQYINSKKFMKSLEWYSKDYSKYLPYLIPHKSDARKLFCILTRKPLNKIPDQLEKHVRGKKYNRLKEAYDQKKLLNSSKTKEKIEEDESSISGMWIPEDDDDESKEDSDHLTSDDEDIDDDDDDGKASVDYVITASTSKRKREATVDKKLTTAINKPKESKSNKSMTPSSKKASEGKKVKASKTQTELSDGSTRKKKIKMQ